jgi:hypothetical protein
MPRFIIERNFAEKLEVTKEAADQVQRINGEEGVKWIFSFLSADKRKTYCLYEAPNADATCCAGIMTKSRRLSLAMAATPRSSWATALTTILSAPFRPLRCARDISAIDSSGTGTASAVTWGGV